MSTGLFKFTLVIERESILTIEIGTFWLIGIAPFTDRVYGPGGVFKASPLKNKTFPEIVGGFVSLTGISEPLLIITVRVVSIVSKFALKVNDAEKGPAGKKLLLMLSSTFATVILTVGYT